MRVLTDLLPLKQKQEKEKQQNKKKNNNNKKQSPKKQGKNASNGKVCGRGAWIMPALKWA